MRIPRLLLAGLLWGIGLSQAWSQTSISIPAATAYAIPVEESTEEDESRMFTEKEGLHNWTDPGRQVQFWFKARNTGTLNLALRMKNDKAGRRVIVSIAGKNFTAIVPASKAFQLVRIGSVQLTDTGFYAVTLHSASKQPGKIADIRSLELSGPAAANVHFNPKPRRNAASVHLLYPLPDSVKVSTFYNEITVPKNADILHSYYMACGFARGYFGIQVNSATERRVIFSVWDAGNEAADRNKVAEENKVKLIAKGEDVYANDFGNEGTGGHSHFVYNWHTEETYRFLVAAVTDSASNTTTYTGYFYIPEMQKWKLIASFRAPKDGKPLRKLYSFVENFWGVNGQEYRKAYFGNQWIRKESGEWKELTKSTFSYDATARAGDRIDYGGGSEGGKFYLWNGGFRNADARFGDTLTRKEAGTRPVIDLYKNADSAVEMNKELEQIYAAVKEGKLDTTGSNGNVFYKILREGSGDQVTINDTLVVRYIGKLLNDTIFDQTKDKPATFPLRRLIRGWQLGMPFCRQGGKIRLIIPSPLGYSIRNLGIITPNSILVFDVEVLEIKKGKG